MVYFLLPVTLILGSRAGDLFKIGKENLKLSEGRGKKGLSITDKGFTKHNTRKEIAKDLHLNTKKK